MPTSNVCLCSISLPFGIGSKRKMEINEFFQSSLELCSLDSFHSTLTVTVTFHPTSREKIIGEHSSNPFGLESRRIRSCSTGSRWSYEFFSFGKTHSLSRATTGRSRLGDTDYLGPIRDPGYDPVRVGWVRLEKSQTEVTGFGRLVTSHVGK